MSASVENAGVRDQPAADEQLACAGPRPDAQGCGRVPLAGVDLVRTASVGWRARLRVRRCRVGRLRPASIRVAPLTRCPRVWPAACSHDQEQAGDEQIRCGQIEDAADAPLPA